MKKSALANIISNPRRWPGIPPWWPLPSPQIAAVLGVTPGTLHEWRALGKGPSAIPTILYKPTRGDPTYYHFAIVRKWALAHFGLTYTLEDQIVDFMIDYFPNWHIAQFPLYDQIEHFDKLFRRDRNLVRLGREPENFDEKRILEWNDYFSKQPRFVPAERRNYEIGAALLGELPKGHLNLLTPKQLAAA